MLLALTAGACGTEGVTGSETDSGATEPMDSSTGPVNSDVGGPQEGDDGGAAPESDSGEVAVTDTVTPDDAGLEGDVAGDGGDSVTESDASEPFVEGWQTEALGDLGNLAGLFVVNANEAYAVGGSQVIRYNGEVWASFGSLGDVELHGIWAGDGVVVVVGEAGFIARRAIEELSWEVQESQTQQHLRAVHGRSPNDLWAAGNEGVILNYTNAEDGWSVVDQTSNIDLYGIHVDTTTEGAEGVVTCGSGGRLVINDAGVWKTSHVASGNVVLNGIFGMDGRLFVVGTGGTIAVRDGQDGSWVGQPTNLTKDLDLYAVAGSSADKVYAFGESGAVLRWLGTSWQQMEVGAPLHAGADFVGAGWAKGVDDVEGHWMVIGADGGGVTSEDGSVWSDMTTQPTSGLTGLVASQDGHIWATGRSGLLMTRQDGRWSSIGTGTTSDFYGVTEADDGALWIVGEAGTVIVRDAEGTLSDVSVPAFTDLLSVHHEPDLVVIGGKGGTLLRRAGDAEGFSPWTIGMTTDVRAITRGGDGALWISGGFGKLYRSEDGESATAITSGVSGGLNAIAPTADGVLIVGDNGVVLEASAGGEITLLHEQSELFLYGLSVFEEHAIAVGWNGTALRLVGDEIMTESTGANQVLEAVLHDGVRAIAVGRVGHAYTRMEGP